VVAPGTLRPPAQILGEPAVACMATLISFGATLQDTMWLNRAREQQRCSLRRALLMPSTLHSLRRRSEVQALGAF